MYVSLLEEEVLHIYYMAGGERCITSIDSQFAVYNTCQCNTLALRQNTVCLKNQVWLPEQLAASQDSMPHPAVATSGNSGIVCVL